MRRFLSVWVWTVISVLSILWLVPMGITLLLTARHDPGRYLVGRMLRRCATITVALNPLWSFHTSGVPIRDPRRPYIVVANHESMADIFLLSCLPWEMKWLAKDSLFRVPVMGWLMRMAGDIRVRRGSTRSHAEAMLQLEDRLAKRVSVMVFPEGTRSRTEQLLPFRDGAFRLAIETGVPILPLAIAGTRDAITPGSLVLGRARAEVRVLPPIETSGLSVSDVQTLRESVQRLIADTRAELMQDLPPRAEVD